MDDNREVRELEALVEELSVSGQCANCVNNDWISFAEPVRAQSL
jgi:hypothetical protein